nr:hypothetical protein [Tanacetum cinerariifolium]
MNCPAPLAAALQAVAASLPDATNHYFLKANYYDHVEDFELGVDELQLDVLLDGRRLADWTRVSIPYSEVWDVLHQRTKGSPNPNGWATLYYDHAAMRMPPLHFLGQTVHRVAGQHFRQAALGNDRSQVFRRGALGQLFIDPDGRSQRVRLALEGGKDAG